MNYTKNHHLPQWVKSDRIRMEDFNDAMSRIESGLNGAETKADAATTAAENAYTPDNKPYVVGSYVGTGENVIVKLGFKPSFLIVSGMKPIPTDGAETDFTRYFALTSYFGGEEYLGLRVQLTTFGFAVYYANNAGMTWPMLTEKGREYNYIAFR